MPLIQPVANPAALVEAMRWRYSTKVFDKSRKIPNDVWQALEETLVLTPSSYGLQPWKFFVITNQQVKENLVPMAWGQRQLSDGSHVVVFAIKKNVDAAHVGRFLGRVSEVRNVPLASLERFKKMLLSVVDQSPEKFDVNEWATRQVYIALGNFMTAAAVLGVDVCPMEGFQPAKVDELLELEKQGYASVVMAVAGTRSAEDKYGSAAKVRFNKHDVIARID